MLLEFTDYQSQYSYLNGCDNMHIKKIDLCRHTMQVGYKNKYNFLSASLYKHFEMFFMVMANVDYRHRELQLKDEYFALDQSEKVCISYQIGQGLTKAVAEKYFNVPWVTHVKTMKNMGYSFTPGGEIKQTIYSKEKSGVEPDLIGFDKQGNAHLFESKGSSSAHMQRKTIQRALNQVSNYINIIDQIGCIQHFITRNACLFNFQPVFTGRVIDPPVDNDNQDSIGLLDCLYNYYYQFLNNEREEFEIINEFNRKWNGYIFSFGKEKYFWGINSLYKEFLQEQFDNHYSNRNKNYIFPQNKDENISKTKKILHFFDEQKYYSDFNINDNDFISIGEDGYILCNLNKI